MSMPGRRGAGLCDCRTTGGCDSGWRAPAAAWERGAAAGGACGTGPQTTAGCASCRRRRPWRRDGGTPERTTEEEEEEEEEEEKDILRGAARAAGAGSGGGGRGRGCGAGSFSFHAEFNFNLLGIFVWGNTMYFPTYFGSVRSLLRAIRPH